MYQIECMPFQESSQRFYKQRDEQAVEYVADGKVIGKEIKYAAETEQMEKGNQCNNNKCSSTIQIKVYFPPHTQTQNDCLITNLNPIFLIYRFVWPNGKSFRLGQFIR